MGSVYITVRLPACLGHARDFATVGELTEADAAQIEVAHKSMFASAAPATTHLARAVLWLAVGLGDLRFGGHRLVFEWEAERLKECLAFFARLRRRADRHLETVDTLDFIRSNFRKR